MGLSSFIPLLLESSLMGSILIGLIILVRLTCKKWLNTNWQYLIWFLLIVRLIIPYAPESSISIFNVFSHLNIKTWSGSVIGTRLILRRLGARLHNWRYRQLRVTLMTMFRRIERSFFELKENIFLGDMVNRSIMFSNLYNCFDLENEENNKNGAKVTDIDAIKLFEECKLALNIKSTPVLIESSVILSPMAAGTLRPHVILPTGIITELSQAKLRLYSTA